MLTKLRYQINKCMANNENINIKATPLNDQTTNSKQVYFGLVLLAWHSFVLSREKNQEIPVPKNPTMPLY